MQINKKMSPGGNLVTRALDYHQQTEQDNNHMITRTTTKRNTPIRRCHLSPEVRAAQLLREFKRERFVACECCGQCKSHQSMAIEQVLWVRGHPTWPYAICRRCVQRAHSLGIEQGTLQRAYEANLYRWWLEVWG